MRGRPWGGKVVQTKRSKFPCSVENKRSQFESGRSLQEWRRIRLGRVETAGKSVVVDPETGAVRKRLKK